MDLLGFIGASYVLRGLPIGPSRSFLLLGYWENFKRNVGRLSVVQE